MNKWIEKYIGIPYKELGRSSDGLDCYGLCLMIYKNELGISIPDYYGVGFKNLATKKERQELKEALQSFIIGETNKWEEVELKNAKEFDLILFRICGYVIHIGILVDNKTMLHSFNGTDCVLESLYPKWDARVYKVIRWVR